MNRNPTREMSCCMYPVRIEAREDLKQAIESNNGDKTDEILRQNHLLNEYCIDKSPWDWTALGYAVWLNKKEIVVRLVSLPDIDLSKGINSGDPRSPLCLAIRREHLDIAAILESNGAKCTEREIRLLGNKYTTFLSFMIRRSSFYDRNMEEEEAEDEEQEEEEYEEQVEAEYKKTYRYISNEEMVRIMKERKKKDTIIREQVEEEYEEQEEEEYEEQEEEEYEEQVEAEYKEQVEAEYKEQEDEETDRYISNEEMALKIEELNEEIQKKDTIIREQEAIIQRKENKMKREEQRQRQIWKFKQNQAQQIGNFQDLKLISEIAHGCDGMVFNCSASDFGIPSVALKILFNLGIDTTRVSASFVNEFAILKELPFHPNIIPIWKNFEDRPTMPFLDLFPPDLKSFVINERTGTVRKTICILMPILECFKVFFDREFKKLGVSEKLSFIEDVMSGLVFLDENNVVHRDMKLNNLLINSSGRIIISDFGCSTKLSPDKSIYIPPAGSLGGNPVHLAPEIKKINTSLIPDAVKVDFSKQASFELGMMAFEIFFGDVPGSQFGEHMDDAYFNDCIKDLCLDDSHKIPEMFEWLRGLLYSDPQRRTPLLECVEHFHLIQDKLDQHC